MSAEIDDLLTLLAQLDEPTEPAGEVFVEADDEDPISESDDDAAWAEPIEETTPRILSHGELTLALHRFVLPNLEHFVATRGYLNLGNLAHAAFRLQGSEWHLSRIRQFVQRSRVPVFPARSDRTGRALPLAAIEQAHRHFGNLVRGTPDHALVIARLGYAGLPLRDGTRAFLVQAWTHHCLARAEEEYHAEVVAAAVGAHGTSYSVWPAEALRSRELLVLDNLWLVSRIARKYLGSGVDIDDLIQAGQLGLFRAVEKHDPSRGNRFVTYASSWAFQAISRYIADHSSLIRLPVHRHEQRSAIVAARNHLHQELGRPPSLRAIAQECDISEDVVQAVLVTARPVSLDSPARRKTIENIRDALDIVVEVEEALLRDEIADALTSLTARECWVVAQRFGLHDGREHTLEEVGKQVGVTRERIRQIEAAGLRRFRHPRVRKALEEWLEDTATQERIRLQPPSNEHLILAARQMGTLEREIVTALLNLNGGDQRSRRAILKQYDLSTKEANQLEATLRMRALCLRASHPLATVPISITEYRADGSRRTFTRSLRSEEALLSPCRPQQPDLIVNLAEAPNNAALFSVADKPESTMSVEHLAENDDWQPTTGVVRAHTAHMETRSVRSALDVLAPRLASLDYLIADARFVLSTGTPMPRERVANELYIPLERVIDIETAVMMVIGESSTSSGSSASASPTLKCDEASAQVPSLEMAVQLSLPNGLTSAALPMAAMASFDSANSEIIGQLHSRLNSTDSHIAQPPSGVTTNVVSDSEQSSVFLPESLECAEPSPPSFLEAGGEQGRNSDVDPFVAALPSQAMIRPQFHVETIDAALDCVCNDLLHATDSQQPTIANINSKFTAIEAVDPPQPLPSPTFARVWAVLSRLSDPRERTFVYALYGLHATKPLSIETVAATFDVPSTQVADVDRMVRLLVAATEDADSRDVDSTIMAAPTAAQLMLLRRAKRKVLARFSAQEVRILLARYGPANQMILPVETIAEVLTLSTDHIQTLSAQFEQQLADLMHNVRRL